MLANISCKVLCQMTGTINNSCASTLYIVIFLHFVSALLRNMCADYIFPLPHWFLINYSKSSVISRKANTILFGLATERNKENSITFWLWRSNMYLSMSSVQNLMIRLPMQKKVTAGWTESPMTCWLCCWRFKWLTWKKKLQAGPVTSMKEVSIPACSKI